MLVKTLRFALLLTLILGACQGVTNTALEKAVNKAHAVQQEKRVEEQKERAEKKRNGTFTIKHKNKTSSTYTLVDGLRQGKASQSYASGKKWKEVNYKNDLLDGLSKVYTKKGDLDRTVEYKMGRRHGWYKKYFKSGNVKLAIQYDNGKPLPGLKRVDYKGQEIKEPRVKHAITKKYMGDTALFLVKYTLNEKKLKDATYYALPNEVSWQDATESLLRRGKLPTDNNSAFLEIPLTKNKTLTVNHGLWVEFSLPNKRRAAIFTKMSYQLKN
jgi:hypothetical protein